MESLEKDRRPPEDVLNFINGFISMDQTMRSFTAAGMSVVGTRDTLFGRVAVKLAKDIGRLEEISDSSGRSGEVAHYEDLLRGWVTRGWVQLPEGEKVPPEKFPSAPGAQRTAPKTMRANELIDMMKTDPNLPKEARDLLFKMLEDTARCPHCRTYNAKSDTHCEKCGKRLN